MSGERVERRLAAILAADVAGYSRLMGEDEAGTLARLRSHRHELIDPKVAEHKGRIVKTTGDGLLIEFPSVVEAVACAVAVQHGMAERNADTPARQQIVFRVGINLGDVIVEDGDIHGDGVNVAARLEALAEPGGICVSGTVRDHIGDRLDLAFDDLGDQDLKNIARPVRVYRVRLGTIETGVAASSVKPTPALALPDKPSIAVLPFQNMSGDPEQEYFADGMVEEIITALSRIRWLFVIARNSTFTYKGQAVDVKQIGRELGVRYVLEGSVRKGGGRVRITAQLIDVATGTHLWADRFDGSLEDVFDLQDKVAASVAGVIEPTLELAEVRRVAEKPTSDLAAYDLYLRAMPFFSRRGKADILEATRLLEQAIARDPYYAIGFSFAAICHMRLAQDGWTPDPRLNEQQAVALARRALELCSNDPVVLANSAFTLAHYGEDIRAMMSLVEKAMTLNPSYARGWFVSATLHIIAGQADSAIEDIERSLRLSPRDYVGTPMGVVGVAHFNAGRYEAAIESLKIQISQTPGLPWPYQFLVASYAHLGRFLEAAAIMDKMEASELPILSQRMYNPNKTQHERFISGVQTAIDYKRQLKATSG